MTKGATKPGQTTLTETADFATGSAVGFVSLEIDTLAIAHGLTARTNTLPCTARSAGSAFCSTSTTVGGVCLKIATNTTAKSLTTRTDTLSRRTGRATRAFCATSTTVVVVRRRGDAGSAAIQRAGFATKPRKTGVSTATLDIAAPTIVDIGFDVGTTGGTGRLTARTDTFSRRTARSGNTGFSTGSTIAGVCVEIHASIAAIGLTRCTTNSRQAGRTGSTLLATGSTVVVVFFEVNAGIGTDILTRRTRGLNTLATLAGLTCRTLISTGSTMIDVCLVVDTLAKATIQACSTTSTILAGRTRSTLLTAGTAVVAVSLDIDAGASAGHRRILTTTPELNIVACGCKVVIVRTKAASSGTGSNLRIEQEQFRQSCRIPELSCSVDGGG